MVRLCRPVRFFVAALLASPLILAGCTGELVKKRADREVFGILRWKSSKVPNSGQDLLNITPAPPPNLDVLERNMTEEDFLGERAKIEKGAKKVSLSTALSYAVHHNRSYQGQKELVYLGALDLTLDRFQYTPIFSAGGTSTLASKRVETGLNTFINDSTLTSTGSTGFSVLSRAGTRIATDLTTDFVRFITGDLKSISDSSIAVTLTQPLLRGAGYRAASEVLTQSERDVLYSVRDFTQFRKSFTVDITSQYFRALQNRESVRNSYLAYKAFNDTVEREKLLAETGQRPTKSFLYQVQQAQLSYDRRWRTAIRTYEQALDDLKVELGIPVTEPVILDRDDFTKLAVIDPPGTLDEALTTALTTRLDLWNQRDQVEDAARKVKVALQDTLPTLNAVGGYDVKGDPGRSNVNVDGRRRTLTGRLDLDLHLNQKPERNNVRAAQIAEQRARRELDLAEEQVRSSIRTAWRDLELARAQYELAQRGLALSEERVKLESELLTEGQGTARDLVDAQQDLIEARDAVNSTLITHTLARLQLWRDMGILFIKKEGDWADVLKQEKPKGP